MFVEAGERPRLTSAKKFNIVDEKGDKTGRIYAGCICKKSRQIESLGEPANQSWKFENTPNQWCYFD